MKRTPIPAIAAALVIAAFGVFAAWTYANRPLVESVSPAPGNVVDGSTPEAVLEACVRIVEST